MRNKVSKSFCTHVGLLGLIGAVIMYFRLRLMNFEGPIFSPTDNPAAFAECLLTRVSSTRIIVNFSGHILFPDFIIQLCLCFKYCIAHMASMVVF